MQKRRLPLREVFACQAAQRSLRSGFVCNFTGNMLVCLTFSYKRASMESAYIVRVDRTLRQSFSRGRKHACVHI